MLPFVLFGWILLCIWCGYAQRFAMFALVTCAGVGMVFFLIRTAIGVDPLSVNALMSYVSALLAALGALGLGWIIGRFVRSFRDSEVRD